MESSGAPVFSFGVVADVQYAPNANGWDFHRTQERHYRAAKKALSVAVADFGRCGVDCVLQLGDLMDGLCKSDAVSIAKDLLGEFARCGKPVYHCLGNHELYCLSPSEALNVFGMSSWHYAFVPSPGWRCIVLNAYAFSTLAADTEAEAFAFLCNRNPNDVRSNRVDWVAGLKGIERRFVPFNGAVGAEQRAWLARELAHEEERVIVVSHVPLCPGSCENETLLWDFEEVLEVLAGSRARIVAVLAGHDHSGGYIRDAATGIHHLTLPSPLVAPNKGQSVAHGVVRVFEDRLELQGFGTVPTMTLPF